MQGDAGGKDIRNGDQVFVTGRRQGGHVVPEKLTNNRNALKDWFNGVGTVPWQIERALRVRGWGGVMIMRTKTATSLLCTSVITINLQ